MSAHYEYTYISTFSLKRVCDTNYRRTAAAPQVPRAKANNSVEANSISDVDRINDVGDPHGWEESAFTRGDRSTCAKCRYGEKLYLLTGSKDHLSCSCVISRSLLQNARPLHLEHLSEHFSPVLLQFKQGNTARTLKLI